MSGKTKAWPVRSPWRRQAPLLLAALAALIAGCGNLERTIRFAPLPEETMRYAESLPQQAVRITADDGTKIPLARHGLYVVPAPPLYFYWKLFGRTDARHGGQEGYGAARVSVLVPFHTVRLMLYDAKGAPVWQERSFGVTLLGGFDVISRRRGERTETTLWRVRLVQLPFIGPCFGFGTGYAKVLWIPFADRWRRPAPVPPHRAITAAEEDYKAQSEATPVKREAKR